MVDMDGTKSLNLKLPFPPSMNGYWRSFNGRQILSAKGRQFRVDAMAAILQQIGKPKPLTGRLAVEIVFCRGDKRAFDVSNFEKGVGDALTHAGVIGDDSQIDDLRLRRGAVAPREGYAVVYIRELPSLGLEQPRAIGGGE